MVIIIQYYIEFRCPKIALIVLKGSNLQMVAFLGFYAAAVLSHFVEICSESASVGSKVEKVR